MGRVHTKNDDYRKILIEHIFYVSAFGSFLKLAAVLLITITRDVAFRAHASRKHDIFSSQINSILFV